MKNTVRLDHKDHRIVMDATFAKLSSNVRNAEYAILQSVRRDYPDYVVTTRQIKRNPSQEHYKGLTYDYMRDYINAHESEENASAVLQELEDMIDISKCHSQGKRYPTIKEWFLDKYPAVKKFGVKEEDTEDTSAERDTEVTPLKETA